MRMEVDVSDYTMGGVLSIECKDREQWLVAFLLKSLNETERNYEIYNKEMLAVIRGLENTKVEQKTSKIWLYLETCSRNKNREDRWT